MDKVHVIFGSTTGMTEAVASKIAAEFGVSPININAAAALRTHIARTGDSMRRDNMV